MTNVRAFSARRIAAASLIAFSLAGATGCASINEQATTKEYNPSDGVRATVKDGQSQVDFRNLMVVTNGKGKEGRVLGRIVNNGSSPATVTIKVDGKPAGEQIKVGTGQKNFADLSSDTQKAMVQSVSKAPGEGISATVTANGTSQDVDIPVLDGSLEQYRKYLPGGYSPAPSPSASEKSSEKKSH